MNTIKIALIIFLSGFIILVNSCAKENEEDILGGYEFCKDSLVSFADNVQPILEQDCVVCHSGPDAENGVLLDSYSNVLDALTLDLMKMINHEPGYVAMPYNRPKLNECKIATIQKWIDEGMLNN